MQNTLPMDIAPINVQPVNNATPNRGAAANKGESSDFGEAIGKAVDQVENNLTNQTHNTEDKNVPNTGEQPKDEADTMIDMDAAAASIPPMIGVVDIQQTIADLIIGKADEPQTADAIGIDRQPQMSEQTVDVLEGLQVQNNEDGIDNVVEMPRNEAQPTQQQDDAEAWMPTGSNKAEQATPQTELSNRSAVDVEQEIETRLQEHLSPLENPNGSEETEIDQTKDLGPAENLGIQVKQVKPKQEQQTEPAPQQTIAVEDGAEPIQPQAQQADEGETDAEPDAETDAGTQPEVEQPKTEFPKHDNNIGAIKAEQQPVTQPKAERAEESVFNRMVENITTNAQQGRREFSINLRPDFMGDMAIELIMTEAGISARIRASDDQVGSMISQHLFKLEQSLKDQGIDVASLEVSVFDTGDFTKGDFNSQSGASAYKGGGGQRKLGRISASVSDSAMMMETLSESQTVLSMGLGSSVEYTA